MIADRMNTPAARLGETGDEERKRYMQMMQMMREQGQQPQATDVGSGLASAGRDIANAYAQRQYLDGLGGPPAQGTAPAPDVGADFNTLMGQGAQGTPATPSHEQLYGRGEGANRSIGLVQQQAQNGGGTGDLAGFGGIDWRKYLNAMGQ